MRQRRDKTRPSKAATAANHRGIPRDAKGVPIFLILPPALQERYDKQMAQCEAWWRGGEPLAAAEAAVRSQLYRQPIPAWLADAIVELAVKGRTPKRAQQYQEDQKNRVGYEWVRDLKAAKRKGQRTTWLEAYAEASSMLEGTLAQGDEDTMSRAYKIVKHDLRARRGHKYFMLKDWRYRNNGKPDPNGPTRAPETHWGNAQGK
jgi:hypothetical protein